MVSRVLRFVDERQFSRTVRLFARQLRASGAVAGAPLIFYRNDEYVFANERSNAVAVAATYYRDAKEQIQIESATDGSGMETPGKSAEASGVLDKLYDNETRAYFEREHSSRFGGSVRTAYRILNDVYSLDGRVIKVRLEKNVINESALARLLMLLRSIATFAISTLPGTEERALRKLKELVTPRQYKIYMTTGVIHEVGKSGVIYYIRRMRPTIAMRDTRPLCALCLHPLAFVCETWVGVMPPTDEVIAHILLIRGDEHTFWKKANQHSISSPQSGI